MASEVRVLNRARYSIMVETGRLAPYATTKVSEKWFAPRHGQETCVDVTAWAEKVRRWDISRLQAEAKRADIDITDDAPTQRRRLFEAIGVNYTDDDLVHARDRSSGLDGVDFTDVDGIGPETAAEIEAAIDETDIDTVDTLLEGDLTDLPDVGPATAKAIRAEFGDAPEPADEGEAD